jgi:uncharacterized Fe-S cluster-containing protein
VVVAHVVNSIEGKVVADREFLQETNFQEEYTREKSIKEEERRAEKYRRDRYSHWVEPDGDPSF